MRRRTEFFVMIADGRAVRYGTADENDPILSQDNVLVLPFEYDPSRHYIRDGAVHSYTLQQSDSKRAVMPEYMTWSDDVLGWADERTLKWFRAEKMREMQRACDDEIDADFVTGQGTFPANRDARQEYVTLMVTAVRLNQLGQNSNVVIEKTNGVPVSATLSEISQLVIALHNRTQAAYVKLRAVRDQIMAANSKEQINSVEWPTNG